MDALPKSTRLNVRPDRASLERRIKSASSGCSSAIALRSSPSGSTAATTSVFEVGTGEGFALEVLTGEEVPSGCSDDVFGRFVGVPSPVVVSGCADDAFGRFMGVPSLGVVSGCADDLFGRFVGVPSRGVVFDGAPVLADDEVSALGRERASATEFARPSRYRMSVVNSAIPAN